MVGWILKNYNYVNSSQNFDFLENCVRVFVCICIFPLIAYKYYTRCTCVCPLILADTGLETGSWGGRPSWWWGDWSRKALRNTYKMDEFWKTLTMWILLLGGEEGWKRKGRENRDQENIWFAFAEKNKIRVGKGGRYFETRRILKHWECCQGHSLTVSH